MAQNKSYFSWDRIKTAFPFWQSFLYPCLEAHSFSQLSINDVFPLSLIERVWYMGVVYPGIKRFVQKIIHLMKLKYCARPWFKNGSRISPKRVTPHFHRFAPWVFKGIKLKRNLWHLGFYLKANWYRWLWNMALFVCCFHFPAITKWNELNALRIRMQRKFYAKNQFLKVKRLT